MAARNTPDNMHGPAGPVALQEQNGRALGKIRVFLHNLGSRYSRQYFTGSEIIIRKFIVPVLRDADISFRNQFLYP